MPVIEWRYFVRLLAAGLIAIFVSWLLHFDFNGAIMVVFFSMLTVQSTLGATLTLVRPVILWSLLGVAVGLFAVLVFGPFVEGHRWVMWMLISGVALYGALVLPMSPLARLSFITALLLVVVGVTVTSPLQHALLRTLYIGLALLISVPASYLIFPRRASSAIAQSASMLVKEACTILSQIMAAALDAQSPWSEENMREQVVAMRNRAEKANAMLPHARLESRLTQAEAGRLLVRAQYRTLSHLFALIRLTTTIRNNPLLNQTKEEVCILIACAEQAMSDWAHQIHHPQAVMEKPDADATIRSIEAKLEALGSQHPLSLATLSTYFTYIHTLRAIALDLYDFAHETAPV